ncbi:outer membrane beta-barrel protein [Puia sp. P3]|uniref:outer membrane beta-barrel protein n=1 Tax=Puia sp. P3 TaxID=3423952 RepID=UPI003D66A96D
MDYFIDRQNTIGFVVTGVFAGYGYRSNSATPIVFIPTNETDRVLHADNHTEGRNDNINVNGSYRMADTSGHELNINADYGYYRLRSDQQQPNNYFDSTGKNLLYSHNYNILSPTDIHIYSLRLDYEQNFLKGKLGTGREVPRMSPRPTTSVSTISASRGSSTRRAATISAMKENINAVYASYTRSLKGWILQGGLRAENTNSKGVSDDSTFTRHYTDLFPSASVTSEQEPGETVDPQLQPQDRPPGLPGPEPFRVQAG